MINSFALLLYKSTQYLKDCVTNIDLKDADTYLQIVDQQQKLIELIAPLVSKNKLKAFIAESVRQELLKTLTVQAAESTLQTKQEEGLTTKDLANKKSKSSANSRIDSPKSISTDASVLEKRGFAQLKGTETTGFQSDVTKK
mmetsp:Transcript_6020/g.5352  ORF Transcript_6020/g.5352 Transcript_6020/m.5352 type:complete len:142 (+) Transcript_6020:401-826(+)|eukprot:CAMPEP_0114590112 /NCGR_PEP_ID=MMETSP0125-20121206/12422_1 /TAXON_ID=485358 ORGANISM="Aristerostoma sp., Strain ATCC 50986" /NCGR_SAMPLE_ID=MMETSP0125 /ASSEMBLY_ACC=CAM_ASM_000245 /LENGTH=141 /DNA_ID=CAMNT_0001787397 /DNA_START=364 /DNA_END=789 /DNA_ORIENTATION=+